MSILRSSINTNKQFEIRQVLTNDNTTPLRTRQRFKRITKTQRAVYNVWNFATHTQHHRLCAYRLAQFHVVATRTTNNGRYEHNSDMLEEVSKERSDTAKPISFFFCSHDPAATNIKSHLSSTHHATTRVSSNHVLNFEIRSVGGLKGC